MISRLKAYFSKSGITARIVALFAGLVIVPYLVLAVVVFVVFQRYSVSSMGQTTVDAMSVVGSQISEAMEAGEEASMTLYYNNCVGLLESGNTLSEEDVRQIREVLDGLCFADTGVRSAYIITPNETIFGGGNFPELLGLMEPYRSEIEAAGGRCVWYATDGLHGKANENMYVLARRLNGKDGQYRGLLYMVLDDRMVTDAFKQMTSEYSTRYLVTEDGTVLYSSDKEMFGERLDISAINPKLISSYQTIRKDWANETIMVSKRMMRYGWYCISTIETSKIFMNVLHLVFPFVIISIIYIGFLIIMLHMIRRYVFRPLRTLKHTMDDYAQGNLEAVHMDTVGIGEFQSLSAHFNSMSVRICDLVEDYKEEVDEKNRQKMLALTSQLTPHFIYNALNTIKWLAVLNHQDNIQNLTESLVYILMNAAKVDDENYTVQDELTLVENYAVIQRARFMNFDLVIDKDEASLDCRIRKFLLQPIVENSIVHGLGRGKIQGSLITVKVWADRELHIQVIDKGVGFDVKKWRENPVKEENHTNIGLHNVEEIIRLEYGEAYGINIDSKPGEGTTVTYLLPVIRKDADNDSDNNSR